MQMSKTPIILGIDPGTQILGFAVLKGGTKPVLIHMDVLKLTKEKDIYARLQLIHAKIIELIEKYEPAHFAIEAPFFGKNGFSKKSLRQKRPPFFPVILSEKTLFPVIFAT
jgi:crossover junction endodeoxyribonuclease RuvC